MIQHHHYRSPVKRGIFSFLLVTGVMLIGTVGMHELEHLSWIDAFYFTAMIATAQGPMMMLQTSAGKIFAAVLSFVSVGTVVTTLGFLFGPFFGKLWKIGVEHLEEERLHAAKNKKEN